MEWEAAMTARIGVRRGASHEVGIQLSGVEEGAGVTGGPPTSFAQDLLFCEGTAFTIAFQSTNKHPYRLEMRKKEKKKMRRKQIGCRQ